MQCIVGAWRTNIPLRFCEQFFCSLTLLQRNIVCFRCRKWGNYDPLQGVTVKKKIWGVNLSSKGSIWSTYTLSGHFIPNGRQSLGYSSALLKYPSFSSGSLLLVGCYFTYRCILQGVLLCRYLIITLPPAIADRSRISGVPFFRMTPNGLICTPNC